MIVFASQLRCNERRFELNRLIGVAVEVKDIVIGARGLGLGSLLAQIRCSYPAISSIQVSHQPTSLLHHIQLFDVIIEKSDYDIKN